jgi:CheY-like chemotaxis protein
MRRKLLLADDSVTIQRVIELTFADEDIEVVAVGDGQRAVERIESDRPDIILADVGMPERNGYEVAEYVKGRPHLAHIPVVLLTGAFERVDESRARAAGCESVLSKPFEPQTVIGQVRELLARSGINARAAAGAAPVSASAALAAAPLASPPSAGPLAGIGLDLGADQMPSVSPAADWSPSPAPANPDTLDEYFDRLDAAFATFGTPAPAPGEHPPEVVFRPTALEEPPASGSGSAAPVRPAPTGSTSRAVPPAPVPPSTPAPPAARPIDPSPLGDAFAELLAAEQGQVAPVAVSRPGPTAAAAVPAAATLTDDLLDVVTKRVLERMTDRVVRETVSDLVLELAGRLIREEIERIKAEAR